MNRKAKLEKALAYNTNDAYQRCEENYEPDDAPLVVDGGSIENRRLAPLHAALLDAVVALEIIRESLTTEREQRAVVIEKRTREALSKIDKVLGEM